VNVKQMRLGGAPFVLALVVAACVGPRANDNVFLPDGRGDPGIREACSVTSRVCSRCHDLDRVLVTRFDHPAQWRALVDRMRLMPSSGVSDAAARLAVDCLVYRSGPVRTVEHVNREGRP
jgi:hypothetical protein